MDVFVEAKRNGFDIESQEGRNEIFCFMVNYAAKSSFTNIFENNARSLGDTLQFKFTRASKKTSDRTILEIAEYYTLSHLQHITPEKVSREDVSRFLTGRLAHAIGVKEALDHIAGFVIDQEALKVKGPYVPVREERPNVLPYTMG